MSGYRFEEAVTLSEASTQPQEQPSSQSSVLLSSSPDVKTAVVPDEDVRGNPSASQGLMGHSAFATVAGRRIGNDYQDIEITVVRLFTPCA
jgi:hypothetical protein